jgi:hypothetical protein
VPSSRRKSRAGSGTRATQQAAEDPAAVAPKARKTRSKQAPTGSSSVVVVEEVQQLLEQLNQWSTAYYAGTPVVRLDACARPHLHCNALCEGRMAQRLC